MLLQKLNQLANLMVNLTTFSGFIQRLNRYWLMVVLLIVAALISDVYIFHRIYVSLRDYALPAPPPDLMFLVWFNFLRIGIALAVLVGVYGLLIRPLTQLLKQKTQEWLDEFERRQAIEHQLQESKRFIGRVLDTIPDVVYVQDILGKQTLYSNHSLAALLGYQPHEFEALGKENFTQLMHEADLKHLPEKWEKQRAAADDDVIISEFRLKNRDGDWVWVRSRELVFERDKHGTPRQILTTLQDITQEKRLAQQRLQLEMERHQRSMITEFIQNASHDFRTPLTIISNTAYLMSRYDDAAKRDEKMQRIHQQVHHLGALLDDLLLLVELDMSGVTQREKLEVNHLVKDHLVEIGLEPRIQFEAYAAPVWLVGNGALLDKALGAILKNARTHTPLDGKIIISIQTKPGWAIIRVYNNGDVIPPEVLPHIFDRFYRGDTGRSPDKGGMGLGLTIAQKIVQSHYGIINATSSAADGTVFEICLPCS